MAPSWGTTPLQLWQIELKRRTSRRSVGFIEPVTSRKMGERTCSGRRLIGRAGLSRLWSFLKTPHTDCSRMRTRVCKSSAQKLPPKTALSLVGGLGMCLNYSPSVVPVADPTNWIHVVVRADIAQVRHCMTGFALYLAWSSSSSSSEPLVELRICNQSRSRHYSRYISPTSSLLRRVPPAVLIFRHSRPDVRSEHVLILL